jgi:hypothetical protein
VDHDFPGIVRSFQNQHSAPTASAPQATAQIDDGFWRAVTVKVAKSNNIMSRFITFKGPLKKVPYRHLGRLR